MPEQTKNSVSYEASIALRAASHSFNTTLAGAVVGALQTVTYPSWPDHIADLITMILRNHPDPETCRAQILAALD